MSRKPFMALLGLAVVSMATVASCRKSEADPPAQQATPPVEGSVMVLDHHVDAEPLMFDTIRYFNEGGEQYSVTRLEYYLSGLIFKGTGNTADHVVPGPWYVNGQALVPIDLGVLPAGEYEGITVQLGLPPELNETNALPATAENVNMAWPIPMGGGYHFLKFEGHFIHQGQPTGFAMHLGRDANLVTCHMPQPFLMGPGAKQLTLQFNLNEVFSHPHMYDLATGNQSMGSDSLMALLRDNCANAFTFLIQP